MIGTIELAKWNFKASDILRKSDDAEELISGTSYAKAKSITFEPTGNLDIKSEFRIKFALRSGLNDPTVYGRIYKNGVAVGTARSTTSDEYVTFTEDISPWQFGDTIELWCMISLAGQGFCRNFRVYGDLVEMEYEPSW